MRTIYLLIPIFLGVLTSCASTKSHEEFNSLSKVEQSYLVCDNANLQKVMTRELRDKERYIDDYRQLLANEQQILQQGYRLVQSCETQYREITTCTERSNGRVQCIRQREPEDWYGTRVCKDVPVAIESSYVEKKISEYEGELAIAEIAIQGDMQRYDQARRNCIQRVHQNMSVLEAYEAYIQGTGPFE